MFTIVPATVQGGRATMGYFCDYCASNIKLNNRRYTIGSNIKLDREQKITRRDFCSKKCLRIFKLKE